MRTKEEKIRRYFRRIVGTLVLMSAILAYFHSQYWLLATAFIGLNMIQYSFTDWCPLTIILDKIVK